MRIAKILFRDRGQWSKPYSYEVPSHLAALKKNDVVVVPTGDWYGVGLIVSVDDVEAPTTFEVQPVIKKIGEHNE